MPKFTWTSDHSDAAKEQLALRDIILVAEQSDFEFHTGLAIGTAYDENNKRAIAAGITFDDRGRCSADAIQATAQVDFPYVPGLLAFRVGPAVCELLDRCIDTVELLVFDGQGIAHPRGVGLAAHIGALYDKPAIGVTRNNLFGSFVPPASGRWNTSEILHPVTGFVIGYAASLGANCDPCYISPGHRLGAKNAVSVIRRISAANDCFPKPLRRAHAAANRLAKSATQHQH